MSVFGGDSWAREAQFRKRRVDDLMIEGIDASSYKKLPSGKFACLICPKNPVLDTPIMLATHMRGSRHRANESRHKVKEFSMREEVNSRIAFSSCANTNAGSNTNDSNSIKLRKTNSRPLIERAQKAASEVIYGEVSRTLETSNLAFSCCDGFGRNGDLIESESTPGGAVGTVQPLEHWKCQEMELKFTAAGWKRDCHGRWFKDENVEFDSDEEDPNIVLNNNTR